MQLTENFALVEFMCKDGTPVPDNLICNVQALAEQLQILRDHLGEPVRLNSGYRTPAYNKKIGGAPKSQHLLAKAADITVKSKTPKQLKTIIEKLIKEGKMKNGGIGLYAGFIHYDIGAVRRW
jgi:uncharacterized protein YcbK (DUF882 family)